MTWQHTFIPALPRARTVFLEAPTPYLIGVLIESNQGRYIHADIKLAEGQEQSPAPHPSAYKSYSRPLSRPEDPQIMAKFAPTLGLGKISTYPLNLDPI